MVLGIGNENLAAIGYNRKKFMVAKKRGDYAIYFHSFYVRRTVYREGGRESGFRRNVFILLLVTVTLSLLSGCSLPFSNSSQGRIDRGMFIWPVKGKLTSRFGLRGSARHEGIDIAAPAGTKIVAAADGKVTFSGWGPSGYGKIIMIKHSAKYVTVYSHNSKNLVLAGKSVKQGDAIALVGETGRANGSHLHFEVRVYLIPRNPLLYLPINRQ